MVIEYGTLIGKLGANDCDLGGRVSVKVDNKASTRDGGGQYPSLERGTCCNYKGVSS